MPRSMMVAGCLQENLIWEQQNKGVGTKYQHVRRLATGETSNAEINLIKIQEDKIGGSAFEKPKKEKGEHGVVGTIFARIDSLRSNHSEWERYSGVGSDELSETFTGRGRRSNKRTSLEIDPTDFFVLKSVEATVKEDQQNIMNEIAILKSMDHPNIVKAFEVYYDKRHTHVVMECCIGGNLHATSGYSERRVAQITKQILSAVMHMHHQGVVHRNLTLEHLMFVSHHEDSMVKIINFEKAKKFEPDEETVMSDAVGTLYTMSPEMLAKNYNSQTDLWSVGVIMFILLSQKMPFYDAKPRYMAHRIMKGSYKMKGSVWDNVSGDAKGLVHLLLEVDPQNRVTAANALDHMWLKNGDELSGDVSSHTTEYIGQRLRGYLETSELKKIALNVVAHRSPPEEMSKIRKVFDSYDKNKNGVICFDEFNEAMQGYNHSPQEIEALFNSIDVNNQGTIGFTEFLAATIEEYGFILEERIAEAFDRIDFNNTGYIKRNEIEKIMGSSYSKEKVDEIMKDIDTDNDGRIYYDEFLRLFKQSMSMINLEIRSMLDNNELDEDDVTESEAAYQVPW